MASITQERIFEIADALDMAGQQPTLAAVRKKLSGGSFTTISEAMTVWKAKKQAKDTPRREPVPQPVLDHLQELGSTLWALALEQAHGRLATERETLEGSRLQWEAEKKEAADLADQLTLEVEGLKGALQEHTAKLAVAESQRLQEAEQNGVLRAENATLRAESEKQAVRAVEIARRAEDLNAELARVNQHNAELIRVLAKSVKSPSGQGGEKTRK